MERTRGEYLQEGITVAGLTDPRLDELLPESAVAKLREDVEMVRGLCPPFDLESYRAAPDPGVLRQRRSTTSASASCSPVSPGSPRRPGRSPPASTRSRRPTPASPASCSRSGEHGPKHRDRIAFVRLASGHFTRGMKLTVPRTGKALGVHNAMLFQANERELAEEAWAGDIIGHPQPRHAGGSATRSPRARPCTSPASRASPRVPAPGPRR